MNKIILLYDKVNKPNLNDIGYRNRRHKCECSSAPLDCERHTQVFQSGISDKFLCNIIDKVKDFDSDTLYCYPLEHFGTLSKAVSIKRYSLIKNLSDDIVNKLNTIDNFVLFIVNLYECSINKRNFRILHKNLEERGINPEKVVCGQYSNGHILDWYDEICRNKQIKKKIKFAFCDYPLVRKAKEAVENNFYNNIDFLTVKRKKKVLCYNRRVTKPHRMLFLILVERDKLFDDNLISFNFKFQEERHQLYSKKSGFEPYGEWDQKLFIDKRKYSNIFEKLLKREKNIIDCENFDEVNGFGYEYPETYKNSYVSFVTESSNFDPYSYITEKSFKPFCHFHPFIVSGSYLTLSKLRKFGFKTFDKWWDESYDEEPNHNIRFKKAYDIFLQLNKMTLDELHNMYLEMIPILKHNYNLMLDYGKSEENFWIDYKKRIINNYV